MVAKIPIRTVFDGSTATGLAEFQSGEFIDLAQGGIGASLSIGSAGQVLKVNSGGSALEFGTGTVAAAQTTITSIFATDLILGEDTQTAIDFGTANEIDFKVDNAARLTLTASALHPVTDDQIDLGTASLEFKNAFFDGTVTSDAFAGPLTGAVTGDVTGNADTATALATARTIGGTSFDGSANIAVGLAATTTALATARTIGGTSFDGTANIAVGLAATTTALATARTIGGTSFDGTANIAVGLATLATTVTVTDNEDTNENNVLVFVAGADADGGNVGLESDGNLIYNPSTGTLSVPNMVVSGTQTIADTVTMQAENAIVFEGATADLHETTLTIVDPTADRTINLPNQSGTVPVLAAASNTAVTSTPEELNALDGITAVVGELNALDIGSTAVGTAVASKAVILDSSKDYTGIRNLTITGEIDAATGDFSGAVDVAGTTTAVAITASGLITAGAKIDLNGTELILDADADTSITADTDDTIDIRIAGADDFQFTANAFTALSGSGVVVPEGGLTFGSTAISSTAAELNKLDGATVVVGEINALDLGSTAIGIAIASKAVVLDSAKDYTGIRNLTISGELDAATLDVSGAIDIAGNSVLASVDVTGLATAATFEPDGDTAAGDNAAIGFTAAEGLILTGQGSTNDITIKNDADADVITIATGGTSVDVVGDITASTLNADGDTAAGDNAAIGYTAAEGLILTGQGSTNDVTIKNDADADVIEIPTGTVNVTAAGTLGVTGLITASAGVAATGNVTATGTVEPAGDTAAGDNAAIGYTAAEGLILTGQGSTNDVTIKNDADADVIEIPTGTTDVTVVGKFTGGKIVLAATDTDTSNTGSVTIDFSAHQNFVLTLTGNVTLANPSTEAVGQAGVFVFIQDGTGSRTLSLGTDYESPASGGITLSTAAAAVDVVPYFVKASGSIQLGAPQLAFG